MLFDHFKEINNLKINEVRDKYFAKPSKSQGLGDIEHLERFYVCMSEHGKKVADNKEWALSLPNIPNN